MWRGLKNKEEIFHSINVVERNVLLFTKKKKRKKAGRGRGGAVFFTSSVQTA